MSNPFRGDDVAADMITSEDLAEFRTYMAEQMALLQPQFAEIDRIAATGDEALFEEHFGHLSRPRPDPRGKCLLKPAEAGIGKPALCAMCEKMFAQDLELSDSWTPPVRERYAHYAELEDLYRSATSDSPCPLCVMLWMHIAADYCITMEPSFSQTGRWIDKRPRFNFDYISYSVAKAKESRDGENPAYLLNFVYGGNKFSGRDYDDVHSLQLALVPVTAPGYSFHEGDVELNTGSESALEFAAQCIRHCQESHKKCTRGAVAGWKPTRLVELGPLNEPPTPKLIITNDPASTVPFYATLSHRWGGEKIFQLKGSNLDDLKRGIPLDELSKTFQDAFIAAKRLGIRHIWVDSLCIIQDSPDDWAAEAGKMKDVYSNARLNLSATAAETSDDGLFFDRPHTAVVPFTLELTAPAAGDEVSSAPTDTVVSGCAWQPGRYRLLDPSLWAFNISQAPLNERGWVLQERVLAQRVLHFGRSQLLFECHEWDACEMFPSGLPDSSSSSSEIFRRRALGAPSNGHFKRLDPTLDGGWLRETKSMGRLKSDARFNGFALWAELVEAYSALALTRWEDRLVAFGGIAQMMAQRPEMRGDAYLAGLWRRHLPYHLLWSRRKDGGLQTEPMIYIAPSWSWASVQAPVTLHPITDSAEDEILIDILEAETYTASEDVTGSVFGGYIKLKGFLRPAYCGVWLSDEPGGEFGFKKSRMDRTRLSMSLRGPPARIIVWPDETDMFGPQDSMRRLVYCLPVQVWRNTQGDRCTEGLILEQTDFDPTAFKRMGKFKIPVGGRHGHREFYAAVGDNDDDGWAARTHMEKAAGVFSERVITLV